MTVSSSWLLTGPSGSGKATVAASLAEHAVEIVDNLPVELVGGFAGRRGEHRAVAVIDARRGAELRDFEVVDGLRVLYLDARDEVLVRRLNDKRRPHLAALGRGHSAVTAERELLTPLRAAADVVIDTSELSPDQLVERTTELIVRSAATPQLTCTVSSFGYKYGPQLEADWTVDSRLMPNPFWVSELRPLTGLDTKVRDFVLEQPEARHLLDQLTPLVAWSAERSRAHGRLFLHVAIGCTGGRHRSVVIAEELGLRLGDGEIAVNVRHRDVERPDPR